MAMARATILVALTTHLRHFCQKGILWPKPNRHMDKRNPEGPDHSISLNGLSAAKMAANMLRCCSFAVTMASKTPNAHVSTLAESRMTPNHISWALTSFVQSGSCH